MRVTTSKNGATTVEVVKFGGFLFDGPLFLSMHNSTHSVGNRR